MPIVPFQPHPCIFVFFLLFDRFEMVLGAAVQSMDEKVNVRGFINWWLFAANVTQQENVKVQNLL